MSFEIPDGLTDLLQDFTVAVLKERPPDLVKFAADYFNKLNDRKNEPGDRSRGVRFAASEPMQTDESDDEPMPGMLHCQQAFGCPSQTMTTKTDEDRIYMRSVESNAALNLLMNKKKQ